MMPDPKNVCIDCGKMCHGKRCRKCYFASRGPTKKQFCIDCGIECYGERCLNCRHIHERTEEFRRKHAIAVAKSRADPKVRKKISVGLKAAHVGGSFDDWLQKMSAVMKTVQNRPEVKRKKSEASKAAWARGTYDKRNASEEWKRKIAEGVKAAHARGDFGELSGEKNPNWRGGISFEPYGLGWTIKRKRFIRERDGYKCAVCDVSGNIVHHIDYNKKNHELDNLITLCKSCHTRTNWNRDFWQSYFEGQIYLAMGVC